MASGCIRLLRQVQLKGPMYCGFYQSAARCITIRATPATPPPSETHEQKNARLNRPQSPHLTIYKPQLTAMMSITHRATGMALGGYMMALGIGALVSPVEIPVLISQIEALNLSPIIILPAKSILAFPAAYHLVNGVRHLAWDTGRFLTLKEVYTTGYVTLALSAVLTAWLMFL